MFKIPDKLVFENVKEVVIFQERNDYYISIVYNLDKPEYKDNNLYQAIDLGITKIVTAINSHGKFLEVKTPRPDQYWKPIISNLQSRRDHCKKYSQKWHYLNNTINRLQRKLSNQLKDFQHKLSRKVVDTRANTIIVGDLSVKNMAKSQNKGLNRSTQNTGFLGRFVEFLTYKAKLTGKKIIRIDEAYTSKTCCNCGKIHKNMKLYNRTMKCECGNNMDRDRNSAINIMIRFLSQNAEWTGYQTFVLIIFDKQSLST